MYFCRWANPPPEYRSLLYYWAQEPGRLTDELEAQSTYYLEKVIPRINKRFWKLFGTGNREENKKYPWEDN